MSSYLPGRVVNGLEVPLRAGATRRFHVVASDGTPRGGTRSNAVTPGVPPAPRPGTPPVHEHDTWPVPNPNLLAVISTHNFTTLWPPGSIQFTNTTPDAGAIRPVFGRLGFTVDSRTDFTRSTLLPMLHAEVVVLSAHGNSNVVHLGHGDDTRIRSWDIPELVHTRLVVLMTCSGARYIDSIAQRFHTNGATVSLGFRDQIMDWPATTFVGALFRSLEEGNSVFYAANAAKEATEDRHSLIGTWGTDTWRTFGNSRSNPFAGTPHANF